MYNMSHIKDYVSDNVQTQNNVSFIKLQSVKLKHFNESKGHIPVSMVGIGADCNRGGAVRLATIQGTCVQSIYFPGITL